MVSEQSNSDASDDGRGCDHWKIVVGRTLPYRACRQQLNATRTILLNQWSKGNQEGNRYMCSTEGSRDGCQRRPCPFAVGCKPCVCFDCDAILCVKSKNFVQEHFSRTGHSMGYCMYALFCFQCADFVFDGLAPGEHEPSLEKVVLLGKQLTNKQKLLLRGIANLGNTCFVNCIIQVLVHTPRMNNLLITTEVNNDRPTLRRRLTRSSSGMDKSEWQTNDGTGMLPVFKELLQQFQISQEKPVIPTQLLAAMYEHIPHLAGHKQQDAHEFFISILNSLHVELIRCPKSKAAKLKTGVVQEKESLIDQIFLGRLQSEVTCTVCSHSRFTVDPFRGVALEIVQDAPPDSIDVNNLLSQFTRLEHLDESAKLFCPCCNTKTISTRRLTFKVLPPVVCLQLKRFQHNPQHPYSSNWFKKLKTAVEFPLSVDFAPFLSENVGKPVKDFEKVDNSRYKLYAITTHVGTYASGHYYSYIRKGLFWFRCNDATINMVSNEEAINSEGYLLFYRKANSIFE